MKTITTFVVLPAVLLALALGPALAQSNTKVEKKESTPALKSSKAQKPGAKFKQNPRPSVKPKTKQAKQLKARKSNLTVKNVQTKQPGDDTQKMNQQLQDQSQQMSQNESLIKDTQNQNQDDQKKNINNLK